MTHYIKLPLAFIALVCALPVATPAAAQDDVLVVSQSVLQQWQEDRAKELARLLRNTREPFGRSGSGIVQMSFTLDADGRPTRIETIHNSAGAAAQRTARWAVSHMRNLDQVPVKFTGGVTFQANVIFARDLLERDELAADLAAMEEVRLASAIPGTTVIAIG